MRKVFTNNPLPRIFTTHRDTNGIVAEFDVGVKRHGRLHAKVLIFDKQSSLNAFWKWAMGHSLGKRTLGAVNSLCQQKQSFKGGVESKPWLVVDPTYFAVVGLLKNHLTCEIICHESIHAGFAYAKRMAGRNFDECCLANDEENVCYPAGIISHEINIHCHKRGLYK